MSLSGSARKVFRIAYPADHVNFMTPEPLEFGFLDPITVFEISRGTGFDHEPIFGVTIVHYADGKWTGDLERSKGVFTTRDEAEAYVLRLLGEMRGTTNGEG